jgi:hypothetical protein
LFQYFFKNIILNFFQSFLIIVYHSSMLFIESSYNLFIILLKKHVIMSEYFFEKNLISPIA